jgi:hypothetical protein
METGDVRHDARASSERAFEPPVDPGEGGRPADGLFHAARILRARALAAEAAGMPPLDSDQVLDLQRSSGNRLTARALAPWTEPPPG